MLSPTLTKAITVEGLDALSIEDLARRTITEDLNGGVDLTSDSTIPTSQESSAQFRARKTGVAAGVLVAAAVLEVCEITEYIIHISDGETVEEGQVIISAKGNTQKLLLAERSALNFLGHLSGIASLTSRWVLEVAGTSTKIRDTRKTTPLLRNLEKFAVRMGGGVNHRMSLSGAALIKDNHILAAGGIRAAFESVRAKYPDVSVEVEVDTLEQLKEVLAAGADLVLLDNMSVQQTREAVEIAGGRTKLESSGGLSIENAKAYASTGVDYLAIGVLTHSAPVLDIGLDFTEQGR